MIGNVGEVSVGVSPEAFVVAAESGSCGKAGIVRRNGDNNIAR